MSINKELVNELNKAQESIAELEAELAELREAAQAVARTWPFTTDTEIDGLAAALQEVEDE